MALYENIFIVRQDISSAHVDAISDGFEEVIRENGGSVEKREYWGLRTLAYRIKKNKKGHYVLFNIDAPTEAVQELARQMYLHEDVLRQLTIRLEKFPETPSPIMLTKSDRDRDRASRDSVRAEPESEKTDQIEETPEKVVIKSDVSPTETDKDNTASQPTIVADPSDVSDLAKSEDKDEASSEPPQRTRSAKSKTKSVDSNETEPSESEGDITVKPKAASKKKVVEKKPTKAKSKKISKD